VAEGGEIPFPEIPDVVLSGVAKVTGTIHLDTTTGELVRSEIGADITARFVASELDQRARVLVRLRSVLQLVPAAPDAAKSGH